MSYIEDLKRIYGFVRDSDNIELIRRLSMKQSLTSLGINAAIPIIYDMLIKIPNIASTDIPPDTPTDVIPNRSTFTITLPSVTEKMVLIGRGERAAIFRGKDTGYIYKRLNFNMLIAYEELYKELETFARELCIEVFIQTVLNNDDTYGKHIPKVIGVYRDSKNRKRSDPHSPVSVDQQQSLSFFIVMEYAGERLDILPSSEIPYTTMVDIGNILHHFWKRYRLKHFDLHGGNVLLLDNVVKITDFDAASIRIRDTDFAVFQNNYATDDLFTLMTSLRDNSVLFREGPLSKIARIIELFLLYDPIRERINVYNVMKEYIASYNDGKDDEDKIELLELTQGLIYRQLPKYLWDTEDKDLLLNDTKGILKKLQPERFAQIWSAIRSDPELADRLADLATGVNIPALIAWFGAHPGYVPLLKGGFSRKKQNRMTRKHKHKSRQSRKTRRI